VLGTAAYLSPEQASGEEAGGPSDIYSLGVCAYQFLAGRLPHEYGSLTELALKQQQDPVPPLTEFRPDVPRALDRAIRVCLERDPRNRYATALEMATALEAGLHGESTEATQRLGEDSTALLDRTAATQALPVDRTRVAPAGVRRPPVAPVARRPERQRERRSPVPWIVAGLIALLAGALVVLALTLPGGDREHINRSNIQSQVRDLQRYVRDHTK
jgi:serine/threonine-protein kinase